MIMFLYKSYETLKREADPGVHGVWFWVLSKINLFRK